MAVKRVKSQGNGHGNDTVLRKVIEKQTLAWNQARMDERGERKRSMYASDYGQCLRKTWFNFFPKEYPVESFDPRVLRIFHNGDNVHERLSEYFRKEKSIGFEDEIDIPRDHLEVHGRCDGICTVDGQAVIVEFKSINRSIVYTAKEEHEGQVMWYMMMWRMLRNDLKKDFGFKETDQVTELDIRDMESLSGRKLWDLNKYERWILFTQGEIRGELIYESKQNQQVFCFPIPYDEDKAKKIRLWYDQLKWHVDNKMKPNVKYDKEKFPCQWGRGSAHGQCPYFEECWGKNENGK